MAKRKIKICLDAGHGINTAGKRTPMFAHKEQFREAEQNYPIMLKVKEYLLLNNISVKCTNEDIQVDMPLVDRVWVANNFKADLFISIHKNAMGNVWQDRASGISSHIYAKGGEAEKFAKIIQQRLPMDTGMKNRGVVVQNLYVTRKTTMPAVLLELGFMDYSKEAWQMRSDWWHDKYARLICLAIADYFNIDFTFEEKEEEKTEEFKDYNKEILALQKEVKEMKTIVTDLKGKMDYLEKL